MADYPAFLLPEEVFFGPIATVVLSGTVTKSSVGSQRKIIAYKKNQDEVVLGETISDSNGDFSMEVNGGTNDLFRVICIGEGDENSEIFDGIEG